MSQTRVADDLKVFLLALGIISYEAVDLGYGRKMSSLTRTEASGAMKVSVITSRIHDHGPDLQSADIVSSSSSSLSTRSCTN